MNPLRPCLNILRGWNVFEASGCPICTLSGNADRSFESCLLPSVHGPSVVIGTQAIEPATSAGRRRKTAPFSPSKLSSKYSRFIRPLRQTANLSGPAYRKKSSIFLARAAAGRVRCGATLGGPKEKVSHAIRCHLNSLLYVPFLCVELLNQPLFVSECPRPND